MNLEEKIVLYFNTANVNIYKLKNKKLELVNRYSINFDLPQKKLFEQITNCIYLLEKYTKKLDNKHIRLYATGIFQSLNNQEKNDLINQIFIDFGLYFNIISPDLERFYLNKTKVNDIVYGLVQQEFRSVVVCGSYQHHLKEIEAVINILHKYNINILSPKSTKIKQETIGTPFVLFDYQDYVKNNRDTWRHKFEHMEKFIEADAIIVCNPTGIIGKGTIFEFGFMVAYSKRIIFTEEAKDISVLFPFEIGLNFS